MDAASVLEQHTQDRKLAPNHSVDDVLRVLTRKVSNLPAELAHLLLELGENDMKYYETRKRIQQRDNQLHKHIKQSGSLSRHPKEQQIYQKIDEDFKTLYKLQESKCVLANTALFLITKHLHKLESDIETLENEGLLAPLEMLEQELSLTSLLSSFNNISLSSRSRQQLPQQQLRKSYSASTQPNTLSSSNVNTRQTSPQYSTPSRRQLSEEYQSDSDMIMTRKRPGSSSLVSTHPNVVLLSSMSHPFKHSSSSLDISISAPTNHGDEDEVYCFCRQVSFGNMIACDNSNCEYEWFHLACVGLKEPPQGTWYCPECSKIMLNRKSRKKK